MRRLYCYVEPDMNEEVLGIAPVEDMAISATVRELLKFSLASYQETKEIARAEGITPQETMQELVSHAYRYYRYRQGTLNSALPTNAKTFFCPVCGQEEKIRRQLSNKILNEEYKLCEDCFFADKHKPFIATLLNRA